MPEDDIILVHHCEMIGTTPSSTCLLGLDSLPTCALVQGVPRMYLSTCQYEPISSEDADAEILVTEQAAEKIIDGLQRWLRDRQAYRANLKLNLEEANV